MVEVWGTKAVGLESREMPDRTNYVSIQAFAFPFMNLHMYVPGMAYIRRSDFANVDITSTPHLPPPP